MLVDYKNWTRKNRDVSYLDLRDSRAPIAENSPDRYLVRYINLEFNLCRVVRGQLLILELEMIGKMEES